MPDRRRQIAERAIQLGGIAIFVVMFFAPGWLLLTIGAVLCLGLLWRIRHDNLRW